MILFKRLWQRVFIYSFMLVVVAGAMGAYLVDKNLTVKASAVVIAFTGEIHNALRGQSADEAARLLKRFNNREARLWLEDGQGNLLAGERFAGRAGKDWAAHVHTARRSGDITLWQTTLQRPLFLVTVPCELRDGTALLYAAYMAFPVPPLETLLSPGLLSLSLITGVLALWIALRVGKPLRRLQEEVSQVSGSPAHLNHVTVTGFDEVADVSKAINRLVDSLRTHIDGMNELVLNVSHELRSPLTRMNFSTEMIGEGIALCKRYENCLDERDKAVLKLAETNFSALCQELEYMNQLIGDTLFAGKLAVRDTEELTARVSFSAVCLSAGERFAPAFVQDGIRFGQDVEMDIDVRGDETLLTQVVSNLLDNAGKYAAGPEPRITLGLSRENGRACLTVENTCAPLPAEAFDHLFEPYFRYGQQTGTGVGLGLSIVQRVVLLHDGTVCAGNTGAGVRFHVSLPLWNESAARAPRPSSA